MKFGKDFLEKLNSARGGTNRLVVILAVITLILLAIIAVPGWKAFQYRSEYLACEQAMKSANDGLIIEYLGSFEEGDVDQARKAIDQIMVARPDICPKHGNIFLVKGDNGVYTTVCGLHDKDVRQRTRLNATYCLEQLRETRKKLIKKGNDDPGDVEITSNGEPLTVTRVTKEEMIHRGTKTTNGYEGVVAYYGVKGDFEFSAKAKSRKNKTKVKDGDICYFVYADEDYCAIWRSRDNWTGDAYED